MEGGGAQKLSMKEQIIQLETALKELRVYYYY